MKKLVLSTIILSLCLSTANAQTTGTIYADGTESSEMQLNTKEYSFEFPIEKGATSKTYNVPMMNFVGYKIVVGGGDESCELDDIYEISGENNDGNWPKLAKKNYVLKETMEAEFVTKGILARMDKCGWPDKEYKFRFSLETWDKSKEYIIISEAWMTIPADLKQKHFANSSEDTKEYFTTGIASSKVSEPGFEDAVEVYMEKRNPGEDITTINLTDIVYAINGINFEFDGFYITQTTDACKYNSFYGKGVKNGSRYNISFFNSMTREKSMDCNTADELRNR